MLNPLLNAVRKKVSQDRLRYKDDKFDLDLSYISDRIIAMAFPGEGIESAWRNHIDHVAEMLNEYHGKHYKIWNLSERSYDYSKFNNQLLEFGFPDHHSPPLDLLFKIILSIDTWLKNHEQNVAVVHCLGGKGRTGTVVACYMYYCGLWSNPQQALVYFAQRRSAHQKGVTQPSQKRYVQYFGDIISRQSFEPPRTLNLSKIIFKRIPKFSQNTSYWGCKPIISVYSTVQYPKRNLYSSDERGIRFVGQEEAPYTFPVNCLVKGDVLVKCVHCGKRERERKLMFRVSFHTNFINQDCLILRKSDLDDLPKDKVGDVFPDDFEVEIYFEVPKRLKIFGIQDYPDPETLEIYTTIFNQLRDVQQVQSKSQYIESTISEHRFTRVKTPRESASIPSFNTSSSSPSSSPRSSITHTSTLVRHHSSSSIIRSHSRAPPSVSIESPKPNVTEDLPSSSLKLSRSNDTLRSPTVSTISTPNRPLTPKMSILPSNLSHPRVQTTSDHQKEDIPKEQEYKKIFSSPRNSRHPRGPPSPRPHLSLSSLSPRHISTGGLKSPKSNSPRTDVTPPRGELKRAPSLMSTISNSPPSTSSHSSPSSSPPQSPTMSPRFCATPNSPTGSSGPKLGSPRSLSRQESVPTNSPSRSPNSSTSPSPSSSSMSSPTSSVSSNTTSFPQSTTVWRSVRPSKT